MRTAARLAAVLLVGFAACGDGGDPGPRGTPATTTADAPPVPDGALVGIVSR